MVYSRQERVIFQRCQQRQAVGPSRREAASCPLILGKGGCPVVTYSDMFTYSLVIIGIIGLFIAANKKK